MKRSLNQKILVVFLTVMLVFNAIPNTLVFATKGEKEVKSQETRSHGFVPPEGSRVVYSVQSTLVPGVVESEIQYNTPDGSNPVNGFIVDIDPNSDAKIMAASKDYNKSGTQTVRGMVEATKKETGRNIVAAINADLNWSGTGLSNGPLIIDDEVYSDKPDNFFGIKKDGQAIIGDRKKYSEVKDELSQAVRGMGWLVRDGKVVNSSTGRAPRTAVGIKEDGTVFFYVVEGRNYPTSVGVATKELAEVMRDYGAVMAMNLDGGGSTTYFGKREGIDEIELRNEPSDGVERPSISSLLVYAEKGDGDFHHATIDSEGDVYTPKSEVQFKARGVDKVGGSANLPKDLKWKLKDEKFGSINNKGKFKSNGTEGEVIVYLEDSNGKNVGEGGIEIRTPDEIHFRSSDGFSLGFDESTDFGLRLTYKQRDVVFKNENIKWEFDKELGTMKDGVFTSNPDKTVNGTVKATIVGTDISKEFTLEIGKLPVVIYDFEDDRDNEQWKANFAGNVNTNLSFVHRDSGEPVRFGDKSLRMDFDFTNHGSGIGGSYAGFDDGVTLELPGSPTGVGMWIYGTEEAQGLWLRTGIGVEGSPSWKAFDLTEEEIGIDWLGWKYVEVDLTDYSGPYPIIPGQFIRLMVTPNILGGEKTRPKGNIYVDNITVNYGTNVDDHHAPIIDSVKVNEKEVGDEHVIDTDNVTIETSFYDYEDENATGIDYDNVNIYIDGVNYKDTDGYRVDKAYEKAYLSNVELTDGVHEIKVTVIDKAGNETTETRYITVDTGTENKVYLESDDQAVLGKDYSIKLKADEIDNIENVDLSINISDTLADFKIEYGDGFKKGKEEYLDSIRMLNINAKRVNSKDSDYILKITSKIDSQLRDNASISYNLNIGEYEYKKDNTDDLIRKSFSAIPKRINVSAPIKISSDIIKVGEEGTFYVTDSDDNPVENAEVFSVSSDNRTSLGVTDKDGVLKTKEFSDKVTEFTLVAEQGENISFEFNGQSFISADNKDGTPFNIKANGVKNPEKEQNITWFSNTSKNNKSLIQYALKSEYDSNKESAFVEKEGSSSLHTFTGAEDVEENYMVNINKVVIDRLESGEEYVYRVGNGEKWSKIRTFKTIPKGSDTSFLVLGDVQTENYEGFKSDLEKIESYGKKYDFTLQVGDYVDNAGVYSNWDGVLSTVENSFIKDLDMIHVLGNHEYYGDSSGEKSIDIFNLPKGGKDYYYTEYGDTYIGVINYTTNRNTLKNALELLVRDAKKSDAKWKVLATHQSPYYANPQGGSQLFNDLVPEYAEEAGLDFVISGHDHVYTRTKPLIGGQPDDDGIVYMIAGALGEKRYTAFDNPEFHFDEINDTFDSLYLSVDVTNDTFKIDVRDLGNGKIIDSYTKTKVSEEDDDDDYEEHDHDYYIDGDMAVCKICEDSIPLEDYTGFIKTKDENIMYLVGGESYTGDNGLLVLSNDKYFFDVDTGYVFTGKTEIWGLEAEFDENGKLINGGTGFVKRDNQTLYYDKLEMAKGWTNIGKDRYFFNTVNGYMNTGVSNVAGVPYIFEEDGRLIGKAEPGFIKTEKGTVYINEKVKMVHGWQEIDGNTYYFSLGPTGYMRTGLTTIGDIEYEFDKSGRLIGKNRYGFVTTKKGTIYLNEKGNKVHGWQKIGDDVYYFSNSITGYMRTGDTMIAGEQYKFDKTGKLVGKVKSSFVKVGKETIYIDEKGNKVHGWQEIDGSTYYFSNSMTGYMRTGKTKIAGEEYKFSKDGKLIGMVNMGFRESEKGTIYIDEKGNKVHGWQEIDGNTYYFSLGPTGHMRTGSTRIAGEKYKFTEDGKLISGFVKVGKGTIYLDEKGNKVHGWQEIDGNTYYFSLGPTGYMRTGSTKISGKEYRFTGDGKLIQRIARISLFDQKEYKESIEEILVEKTKDNDMDNKNHDLDEEGKLLDDLVSEFIETEDGTYYINEEGEIVNGWYEIEDSIYYFSPLNEGYMCIGETEIDGEKYEFDEEGKLLDDLVSEFIETEDGTYYINEEGEIVNGWYEIEDSIYYFSPLNEGYMCIGETEIDGEKYEFDEEGRLLDDLVSEFIETEDGTYYINEEGEIVNGWYEIEDSIYYFSPLNEGYMCIGKTEIDGEKYEFDEEGRLISEMDLAI